MIFEYRFSAVFKRRKFLFLSFYLLVFILLGRNVLEVLEVLQFDSI